ncbi:MAG: transposase [Serratia symbiotica]|nr:transposase [Serratia symbiotica]
MIKTRRTKRTFSREFKLDAIDQVVKDQRDPREVALALELNPDPLREWIQLYKQEILDIEPVGNTITTTPVEGELIDEFFVSGEYRTVLRMCIFQPQYLEKFMILSDKPLVK